MLNGVRWSYVANVDFEKLRRVSSWLCVNISVVPTYNNNERERQQRQQRQQRHYVVLSWAVS